MLLPGLESPLLLRSAFLGRTAGEFTINPVSLDLEGRFGICREDGWPFIMTAIVEENARYTVTVLLWPSLTAKAAQMVGWNVMQAWREALCQDIQEWHPRLIDLCRQVPDDPDLLPCVKLHFPVKEAMDLWPFLKVLPQGQTA